MLQGCLRDATRARVANRERRLSGKRMKACLYADACITSESKRTCMFMCACCLESKRTCMLKHVCSCVRAVCAACGRGGTSGQGKVDRHHPPGPQPHGAVRRPRCRDDLISLPHAFGPMLASLTRRLLRQSRTSGGFRGLGYARGGKACGLLFFLTFVARTLHLRERRVRMGLQRCCRNRLFAVSCPTALWYAACARSKIIAMM